MAAASAGLAAADGLDATIVVQPRVATIPSRAAQALRSRFSIAAAMRSGNWSGVQANVGMPSAAKACAFSWS
jgi:hypothetical protein